MWPQVKPQITLNALTEFHSQIKDIERENEIATKLAEVQHNLLNPVVEVDLCETMSCGAGRICQMHDEKPKCVCIPECPEEVDTRRLVCTNTNETWPSDCSVYQQRCWCDSGEPGCTNPDNAHMHIDYYGACHEPRSCEGEDLKDFPRRMRDWLFNVMRDLAERDELTEHYMQMELEARDALPLAAARLGPAGCEPRPGLYGVFRRSAG